MSEEIQATENKKTIPGGLFTVKLDDDLTIIRANDYFYQLFGFTREEAKEIGFNNLRHIVPMENQYHLRRHIIRGIQVKREEFDIQFQGIHKNNGNLWFLARGHYDESTKEIKGVLLDITKRKMRQDTDTIAELDRTKRELKKEYYRDPLTGLLNRKGIMESFSSLVEEKKDQLHGFFMLDLDDFKTHNDHSGHLFGDKILEEVSKNLAGLFRGKDIIGRLGGDEFIVILTNMPSEEAIIKKAQILQDKLEVGLDNGQHLSLSQGIALYPRDGTTFIELYKKADAALYEAKANGKSQYAFYTDKLRDIIYMDSNNKNPEIANLVEVSKGKRVVQELREIEQMYRWGLEKARISFWEYNINDAAFTNSRGEVFQGIAEIVAAGKLHKDSVGEVLRMREEAMAGSKEGEIFIKGLGSDNTYEWLKASYRVFANTGEDPLRIFFVAEVLPGEARSKIRYIREEWIKRELISKGVEVYTFNLSSNSVDSIRGENPKFHISHRGNNTPTYESILTSIGKSFVRPKSTEEFIKLFSRERLIGDFHQRNGSTKKLVQMKDEKGKLTWVTIYNRILIHPETGDYYSYLYLKEDNEVWKRENSSIEPLSRDVHTALYDESSLSKIVTKILRQKNDKKIYGIIVLDMVNFPSLKSSMGDVFFGQTFFRMSEDLRLILPSRYICSTKGSGEFIFFLEEEKNISIQKVSEKFLDELKRLYQSLDPKNTFKFHGGIAIWNSGESYEDLYQRAYIARNVAAKGENWNYRFYGDKEEKTKGSGFILDETSGMLKPNHRKDDLRLNGMSRIAGSGLYATNSGIYALHGFKTGLYTRSEYKNVLKGIRAEGLSSLGVVSLGINEAEDKNTLKGMKNLESKVLKIAEEIKCAFNDCEAYHVTQGDFVILCKDVTLESFVKTSIKLQESLCLNFPGATYLGYCWTGENVDIDRLLRHAEELKKIDCLKNREGIATNLEENREEALVNLLRDIKNERFLIFLQPIIDANTGKTRGGEALVREIDEEGLLHLPSEFIRNYETSRIIRYLDLFVLEEACKVIAGWINGGTNVVPISVNFARETLLESNIISELIKISERYNVPRELIEIEVTERLGDAEESTIMEIATSIKESGFGLSLDDFGTEYSNLSIVSRIKLDTLKIDRSLTCQIHDSKTSEVIIRSVLQLCKELNIKSVAEGVETKSQSDVLKEWGCDYLQGFYYSKALPPEDFTRIYLNHKDL